MGGVSSNEDGTRFQALVLPYLADAYALASWLVGNRTDAEDIVQEACLRAFQGFGAFANGSPRAWLLTIVRNTAYSWLGKNRSSDLLLGDDLVSVEQEQAARRGRGRCLRSFRQSLSRPVVRRQATLSSGGFRHERRMRTFRRRPEGRGAQAIRDSWRRLESDRRFGLCSLRSRNSVAGVRG